jgi:hypothetical protein
MSTGSPANRGSIPDWVGIAIAAVYGRLRRARGRVFWLLLILFGILEFADVVTTNLVLSIPGAHEANPIMAAIQTHLGSAWWLPKAAIVAWFAVAATESRCHWPMVCAVSLCAVVVAINLANL